MDFVIKLIERYGLCGLCFAFAVFGLTFFIKWGYKLLTAKIQIEEYRKLANAPIVFFPVGLGVLVWLFYNLFVKEYSQPEIILAGIITGGASIIFYELIGRRIEDAILCGVKNEKLKIALKTSDNDLKQMSETAKELYEKAKEKIDDGQIATEENGENKLAEFIDSLKKQ